jgi:hypothetical protein
VVYDGKLKLPELKEFMADFALDERKEDYVIASKQRKESPYAQKLNGVRIVEDIEDMKEMVLDD